MKLRKLNLEDSVRVTKLLQDEEVSRWTSNIPFPYSEQDAIEWIKKTSCDDSRNPYAIEIGSKLVGCVSHWINPEGEIEVGYWIGKDYWGKGYCSKALSMLLSSPEFPSMAKVVARVMEDNVGSERVLLKNGFKFKNYCFCQKQDNKVDARFYTKEIAR